MLERADAEIFLVSALILYIELVLIRWLGTEVGVFAYLGNLVLVVCFFGSGLGCYRASQPVRLWPLGANLVLIAVLIANPLRLAAAEPERLTRLLSGFEDSLVFKYVTDLPPLAPLAGLVIVGTLLLLVVFLFVPLGQLLGRALQAHPSAIRAYSINIAGSLAGIWLFHGLSWASMPPPVWFALFAVLALATMVAARMPRGAWVAACGLAAAAAVWMGGDTGVRTIWSPYHRLTLQPYFAEGPHGEGRVQQGYSLDVNGIFYQHMLDLSDAFVHAHPDIMDPDLVARGHYSLPFAFKPDIDRMLIVGAGSGNDAAAALRHGARHVECVEIDPRIYDLGRKLHPERPYDSPRVQVAVDDARAYFKRARGPYDVIWFGWLDSVTLGSSYNNLRLDHYVYTRESLEEAKRLLADDGVLILSFAAERKWLAARLIRMAHEVFGNDPLAYVVNDVPRRCGGGGNLAIICGRTPVTLARVADPALRSYLKAHLIRLPETTRSTTDDWPYLYLENAKIPKLHLTASLAILGAVSLGLWRTFRRTQGPDWHFFALGAAFLLLEVQTVSRATLLFGMTWVVNAIVISAVLVMALLANLVAARAPRLPAWVANAGLAVSVAALAAVPLSVFNGLAWSVKLVAASAFLTAPVFFAGLIFVRSFAAADDKARALGSNLIGALVGGLLESLSFVTGLRALVVLVGAFYAAALWLRRAGYAPAGDGTDAASPPAAISSTAATT